jgi:hypothetical protein
LFDHTCLQPLLDLIPGGKGAEMGEKQVVIDSVESRQIRVEHPPAGGVGTPRYVKDGLDGVLAAPAGTKPIGSRLESGLPLGCQRAHHLRLAHAVDDHGNAERTLFSVRLRDVHTLDGLGRDGVSVAAHSGLLMPSLEISTERTRTNERSNHPGTPVSALRHPADCADRKGVILLQLPPALGQPTGGSGANS